MARPTRVCMPGQWHHVRHRAAPGIDLIRHDGDALEWRLWLAATSAQFRVQIHAFVILPGEIRLLCVPRDVLGIAGLMKELARRSARRRGEPIWHSRYGSALIQESEQLLSCLASIDMAAVHAGLVTDWLDWPHGSAPGYCGRAESAVVTPPSLVWSMGNTPFERERRYQSDVPAAWSEAFDRCLLQATDKQWAVGDPGWVQQMESVVMRKLSAGIRGRPVRRI
jgi:putative transposase